MRRPVAKGGDDLLIREFHETMHTCKARGLLRTYGGSRPYNLDPRPMTNLIEKTRVYDEYGACLILEVAQPQLRHLTVCILNQVYRVGVCMACATPIKPKPTVRAQALAVTPAHMYTPLGIALTSPSATTNFSRPEVRGFSQDMKFSHTASDERVSLETCTSRHRAESWQAALNLRLTSGRFRNLQGQMRGGGKGTLS